GGWRLWGFFSSVKTSASPPSTTCVIRDTDPVEESDTARLEEATDPMETSIQVKTWEWANELILAKIQLLHYSCEKSCTLEAMYTETKGDPQSELFPLYLGIFTEKRVRQTLFDELESLRIKKELFRHTYPVVREHVAQGHGVPFEFYNAEVWKKLNKLESRNKELRRTNAMVPSYSESNNARLAEIRHKNAHRAQIRQSNRIEDLDPAIEAWALAYALIRAKRKLIDASLDKSCTLESTYKKMRWDRESIPMSLASEIKQEQRVIQTIIAEIGSVSREMTILEDTYPRVRKKRLKHGYGPAFTLDKAQTNQTSLLWKNLRTLESQNSRSTYLSNLGNTAITRTTAPFNSQRTLLRIRD
ncbi:hypothetical protein QRQ56_39125, partial [Bradyrhizobium sp. U531]|uniref:hypothetical protein n=1 Tax=Bradyrhizobium sp. U531 TaxID=3053458 RepID=UPI003F444B6C